MSPLKMLPLDDHPFAVSASFETDKDNEKHTDHATAYSDKMHLRGGGGDVSKLVEEQETDDSVEEQDSDESVQEQESDESVEEQETVHSSDIDYDAWKTRIDYDVSKTRWPASTAGKSRKRKHNGNDDGGDDDGPDRDGPPLKTSKLSHKKKESMAAKRKRDEEDDEDDETSDIINPKKKKLNDNLWDPVMGIIFGSETPVTTETDDNNKPRKSRKSRKSKKTGVSRHVHFAASPQKRRLSESFKVKRKIFDARLTVIESKILRVYQFLALEEAKFGRMRVANVNQELQRRLNFLSGKAEELAKLDEALNKDKRLMWPRAFRKDGGDEDEDSDEEKARRKDPLSDEDFLEKADFFLLQIDTRLNDILNLLDPQPTADLEADLKLRLEWISQNLADIVAGRTTPSQALYASQAMKKGFGLAIKGVTGTQDAGKHNIQNTEDPFTDPRQAIKQLQSIHTSLRDYTHSLLAFTISRILVHVHGWPAGLPKPPLRIRAPLDATAPLPFGGTVPVTDGGREGDRYRMGADFQQIPFPYHPLATQYSPFLSAFPYNQLHHSPTIHHQGKLPRPNPTQRQQAFTPPPSVSPPTILPPFNPEGVNTELLLPPVPDLELHIDAWGDARVAACVKRTEKENAVREEENKKWRHLTREKKQRAFAARKEADELWKRRDLEELWREGVKMLERNGFGRGWEVQMEKGDRARGEGLGKGKRLALVL